MLADAESPAIDTQTLGDLGGIERVDIEHSQKVPILRTHCLQCGADLFATTPINQGEQGIGFLTGDERLRTSESAKCACLPVRAAAVMQTDVARRLKNKCRKGIEIFHALVAQRLQNPANGLLGHVFRGIAIAQASRRKYAQSQPEA